MIGMFAALSFVSVPLRGFRDEREVANVVKSEYDKCFRPLAGF